MAVGPPGPCGQTAVQILVAQDTTEGGGCVIIQRQDGVERHAWAHQRRRINVLYHAQVNNNSQ